VAKAVASRQRLLKEGRTPNFRDMKAFLTSKSVIPITISNELDNVQNIRDKWLHRLEPVSEQDAIESFLLAEEILRLVDGVKLRVFGVAPSRWTVKHYTT